MPISVSLNRFPYCVTAVSILAPKSEGKRVVLLQHGQVSIKASLDVLPSSGESWEITWTLDCIAAKKEGWNQHLWGRAHNK